MKQFLKTDPVGLYKQLSGSDFKGNIEHKLPIELMYAMLCIDRSAFNKKVSMPEIAYPVVARELLDLYQTCKEQFIDGEDYSHFSLELLADALIIYLRETGTDVKDIHSMSRYDFAKTIIAYFNDDND